MSGARSLWALDATDARILRLLYWSPFNPVDVERGPLGLWDIARILDVHGNTVKRRVADIEAAGILQGLSFFPNAALMGMKVGFYSFLFADDATCDAAADEMFAAAYPGATMRMGTPELRCNIPVPGDQDPDEAAAALGQRLGATQVEPITYRHWDSGQLPELEGRILRAMHKDLFATPPELARAVGVTSKTARRCIQSLRDKRTFCIVPLIDPMAVSGLQSALLDVEVGDDAAAAKQVWRCMQDLLPNGVHDSAVLNFIALSPSPSHLAETIQELRSIPGVQRVTAHVPQRVLWTALPTGLERVSERLALQVVRREAGG